MDLQILEDYKKVRESFVTHPNYVELNLALNRIVDAHQVAWMKNQYAGGSLSLEALTQGLDAIQKRNKMEVSS